MVRPRDLWKATASRCIFLWVNMIGGYTVFVPAEWVQPIDMSVEEAMRSSLIAWMARSPEARAPEAQGSQAHTPEPQKADHARSDEHENRLSCANR